MPNNQLWGGVNGPSSGVLLRADIHVKFDGENFKHLAQIPLLAIILRLSKASGLFFYFSFSP